MNAQIIYYSKYGSTKEIAESIGKELGTENIAEIRELGNVTGDLLIIGSPIYAEVSHKDILHLLRDGNGKIKDKQVALFVVCLAREHVERQGRELGGPVYLKDLENALGKAPVAGKVFGGRMIPSELEEGERNRTEAFYKKLGMPFVDVDLMSENEVKEFVQDIKSLNIL
jgi:menaquinone-dependent protoporphyrinogen IX oxidase